MHLSVFERVVWAASFYGHIVLLAVLFIRHRARSFPVFTAYVIENVVKTVIRFFALYHGSHNAFYITYWSLDALDEAFQLVVFWELAVKIFCPTGAWAPDMRQTFPWLVAGSAFLAFLLTWLAHPAESRPIATLIVRSNF